MAVTTDKPVNASQLAHELGDAALRVVGPDPDGRTTVRFIDQTRAEKELQAAVDKHQADKKWRHPDVLAADEATAKAQKNRDVSDKRLGTLRKKGVGKLSPEEKDELLELMLEKLT